MVFNLGRSNAESNYQKQVEWEFNKYVTGKKTKKARNKDKSNRGASISLMVNEEPESHVSMLDFSIYHNNQCYPLNALIDTGATHTFMTYSYFQKIYGEKSFTADVKALEVAGGKLEGNIMGRADIILTLKSINNKKVKIKTEVLLCQELNDYPLVIGNNLLAHKIITHCIKPESWIINYHGTLEEVKFFPRIIYSNESNHMSVGKQTELRGGNVHNEIKLEQVYDKIDKDRIFTDEYAKLIEFSELPGKEDKKELTYDDVLIECSDNNLKSKCKGILMLLKEVFAKTSLDIGKSQDIKAHIEVDETKLKIQKKRPLIPEKQEFLYKIVREMEEVGIVQENCNGIHKMISNIMLVPKNQQKDNTKAGMRIARHSGVKNESYRPTVDMSDLNKAIINVSKSVLPTPEEIFQTLAGKVVSSVDLSNAYFTIELSEESKKYCNFYVGTKIFTFNRLVQGLVSAPSQFLYLMNRIFSNTALDNVRSQINRKYLKYVPKSFDEIVTFYMDDIYIHSNDNISHLTHIYCVLKALVLGNMKVSPAKSKLFAKSLKVLGIDMSPEQSMMALDKVKASAILNWPKPDSLYTLQSRLYGLNYFSSFIPHLQEVAYPLINIMRTQKWKWGELENEAWESVKTLIKLDIRNTIPARDENLYMTLDASKVSVSSILFVERKNKLKVVSCASKVLNIADANKSIFMKEVIALIEGFRKFKHYFDNTTKPITVFTDSRGLMYTGRGRHLNASIANIADKLANIMITYEVNTFSIPSNSNYLADLFSRSAIESRFLTGNTPISKNHVHNLPPLTKPFVIDHKTWFTFLTTAPQNEKNDFFNTKRQPTDHMDLKEAITLFAKSTPEEKHLACLRLLNMWNDIELKKMVDRQIKLGNATEERKLVHDKCKDIQEKVYGDVSPTYATKLKNCLIDNAVHQRKAKYQKLISNETCPQLFNLKGVITEHKLGKLLPLLVSKGKPPLQWIPVNALPQDLEYDYFGYFDIKFLDSSPIPSIEIPVEVKHVLIPGEKIIITTLLHVNLPLGTYGSLNVHPQFQECLKIDYSIIHSNEFFQLELAIENKSDIVVEIEKGKCPAILEIFPTISPYIPIFETIHNTFQYDDKRKFYMINKDYFNLRNVRNNERNTSNSTVNLSEKVHVPDNDVLESLNHFNVRTNSLSDVQRTRFRNHHLPEFNSFNTYANDLRQEHFDEECKTYGVKHTVKMECIKDIVQEMAKVQYLNLEHVDDMYTIIKYSQENDAFCNKIKLAIKDNEGRNFFLKNNILFRKAYVLGYERDLIVVGIKLLPAIIHSLHHKLIHPSIKCLQNHFHSLFYTPTANKFIGDYSNACPVCNISRFRNIRKTCGFTRTIKMDKPCMAWYCDLVPLPANNDNFKGILICQDAFSNYIVASSLKAFNSKEVVEKFHDLFNSQGLPQAIYADSDSVFQRAFSILINDHALPIEIHYSMPYSHQSNLAENGVNQLKKKLITIFTELPNRALWPQKLVYAINAVNLQIMDNYGFSRKSVHFNLNFDNPFADPLKIPGKLPQDVVRKRKHLQLYNKKLSSHSFKVNDIVVMENDKADPIGVFQKLKQRGLGPFKVTEIENKHCTLKCLVSNAIMHRSVDKLKKIDLSLYSTFINWGLQPYHPSKRSSKNDILHPARLKELENEIGKKMDLANSPDTAEDLAVLRDLDNP